MALALVSRLHDLALDVDSCHTLAQHPTYLPCLLSMLSNEDLHVVKMTMETLFLISKNEEARPILANYPGMMTAIQKKLLSSNLETKRFALSMYGTLQRHIVQGAASTASTATASEESTDTPASAASTTSTCTSKTGEPSSYTISISDSLDEDDRQILEDAILQLKGVISLFIDIYSRRCVVRTHTKPEPIIAAICACGVSARLLSPDAAASATSAEKENSTSSASDAGKSWFGWGAQASQAVVRSGETQSEEQQNGWFGRIARSIWG